MNIEVKKHALRQTQDGEWHLTIKMHPSDPIDHILKASMGARFYTGEWIEIDDNEQPMERAAQPLRTTAAPAAPEDPNPPVRPKVAPEKRLARDAGMLCREPGFQQWLKRNYAGAWRLTGSKWPDDERAASTIRLLCHVASRADIRPGTDAERIWQGIVTRYENPGVAA